MVSPVGDAPSAGAPVGEAQPDVEHLQFHQPLEKERVKALPTHAQRVTILPWLTHDVCDSELPDTNDAASDAEVNLLRDL